MDCMPHLRIMGNCVPGIVSGAIDDLSVACLLFLVVVTRVIICTLVSHLPERDLVFIGTSDRLWSVAVSQQPRLPLDRAAGSAGSSAVSWTVWMADAWRCLTTAMSTFLSVCWACGSSTGHLAAHLNHKLLSFVGLELRGPHVASPREHQRSCRSTGSVATSRSPMRV